MKKLSLIVCVMIVSNLLSYPGMERNLNNCTLDYHTFCQRIKTELPNVTNMCPHELNESHKNICLINDDRMTSISLACEKEINQNCKESGPVEHYLCLVNPVNWKSFSKPCLKSLSKGIHEKSEESKKI